MVSPVRHSLPQKLAFLTGALLFLASCGASQQSSYYEDGIYDQSTREAQATKKATRTGNAKTQQPNTYKDYFGQRSKAYGKILDDEIFTDVDSYSSTTSTDSVPAEPQTNYFIYNNTYTGYAGWGDNPTGVTVNLYNNWGWGGYYGWGFPYWRYPYWGFGYGIGYPYWGFGYGWGGYYGHPWYGAYYRPYYRPYYYPRTYTYSATHRGYYNTARTRDTRANSNYFSRYRTSNPNTERYRSSRNSNVRRSSGTHRGSSRVSSGGSGRRR